MKINDKHLAHFASAGNKPDLEGWLWKKGELNTSYQKRWCALRGNLFFYFEKRNDKEPIGVIFLENSFVQLTEGGDSPYTFSIHFTGEASRVYKLTADDEINCTTWIRALSSSSYRYLAILVDGLERDVKTLKATKSFNTLHNEGDTNHNMQPQVQPLPTNKLGKSDQVKSRSTSLVKSCSLPDILDTCKHYDELQDQLYDFDIFPKKKTTHKKISKAKSSVELSSTANNHYVVQTKKHLKNIDIPKKRFSSQITRKKTVDASKKDGKKSTLVPSLSSPPTNGCNNAFSRAEEFTFSKLHEMYRKDIASFIST